MESLDPKEREKLKKLPDARLTGYLVKAGISLEELETMDRTAMLERWAKFVAAGVTGGAAGGATQVPVAVDVNLERERLAFEKAKFEAQLQFERQKAEAQLTLERERLASEEKVKAAQLAAQIAAEEKAKAAQLASEEIAKAAQLALEREKQNA